MKLVGTVSECRNDKGLYTLTIRGLPIPISGISDAHAGLRTCVVGKPRWSSDKGSYFKVAKCWTTDKPDKNSVEVEGTIIAIYPERKNERNRRSLLGRVGRRPLLSWLLRCHPISMICIPITCLLGCRSGLVAIYHFTERAFMFST